MDEYGWGQEWSVSCSVEATCGGRTQVDIRYSYIYIIILLSYKNGKIKEPTLKVISIKIKIFRIDIKLNTVSIPGSPFICTIRDGRDYNKIGEPVLVFGKEGEAEGEFCRPWGVCCTKVSTKSLVHFGKWDKRRFLELFIFLCYDGLE